MSSCLFTVGHSTREIGELVGLLQESGVRTLADVRRYPASRRHPQFNRGTIASSLRAAGIEYVWLPELGGRRTPDEDSPNTAWRSSAFRGYADYMRTGPFEVAITRLAQTARDQPTVLLCAEQAWQRCHRGLIADYLKSRGWEVRHILAPGRTELHPWTAAARIVDGELAYADDGSHQRGFEF